MEISSKGERFFDKYLATLFGTKAAVFIQDLAECSITGNSYNWIRWSNSDIQKRHPYFTKKQIITILRNLIDYGAILVDTNNECKMDRTHSYKLSEDLYEYITKGKAFNKKKKVTRKTSNTAQKRFGYNRDIVLQRDNYRCMICGNDSKILVHHIDGYFVDKPENNDVKKLITVCSKCHRNIHTGKIIIQENILKTIGYLE